MGILHIQSVIAALRNGGNGASAHVAVCLVGLFILSGCVQSSTLPPQNVGVLLTPEEGEQPQGAEILETKLATNAPQKTTIPTPALSPAVKNSLIPTNSQTTPAQSAATKIAKTETTGAQTPTKKKSNSLFDTLFSNNSKNSLRVDRKTRNSAVKATIKPPADVGQSAQIKQAKLSPNTSKRLESKTRRRRAPRIKTKLRDGAEGLPGVRIKKLFGIDTQETEEFDEPVNVAGVANLARRGTHGLLLQRPGVKVGCFPRKLLRILKRVERRFGRTPIVTSGYRSPSYNRRVRGARNSTHVGCLAADIQVKGISKWTLAKYLRTIPGRGGVGTYCHTKSVHIDIGKKRAWHYCKRRRKKRRRS